MKKEARLTGLLLARKGKAAPSPASASMVRPAFEQFENAQEYYGSADVGYSEDRQSENEPRGNEQFFNEVQTEEALNVAAQTVRKLSAIREDSARSDGQSSDGQGSDGQGSDGQNTSQADDLTVGHNKGLNEGHKASALQRKPALKTKVFGKVHSKKTTRESKEVVGKVTKSSRSTSIISTKNAAETKRIAMTLRMNGDDHLKLRLFSAYSKNSCQKIITEALGYYLENNPNAKKFSDQISVG
jgi:hypothetical protein